MDIKEGEDLKKMKNKKIFLIVCIIVLIIFIIGIFIVNFIVAKISDKRSPFIDRKPIINDNSKNDINSKGEVKIEEKIEKPQQSASTEKKFSSNRDIYIVKDSKENNLINFEYVDDNLPPIVYKIKINIETKNINLIVSESSSAEDANPEDFSGEEYAIDLTNDEYEKIIKVYEMKHSELGPILRSLGRGEESFPDFFNTEEVNTYREYGIQKLDNVIKEIDSL